MQHQQVHRNASARAQWNMFAFELRCIRWVNVNRYYWERTDFYRFHVSFHISSGNNYLLYNEKNTKDISAVYLFHINSYRILVQGVSLKATKMYSHKSAIGKAIVHRIRHCFDSKIIIMLVTGKLSDVMTNVWLTQTLNHSWRIQCTRPQMHRRLRTFPFTVYFYILLNHLLFARRVYLLWHMPIHLFYAYLRTALVAYVRLSHIYIVSMHFILNGNVLKLLVYLSDTNVLSFHDNSVWNSPIYFNWPHTQKSSTERKTNKQGYTWTAR